MALLLLFWVPLCIRSSSATVPLPPTEPPLIPNHPFVAVWNAPVDQCLKHGVELDTGAFQEVTTPAAVPGQFVSLFYEGRLGLYPRVDSNNVSHNGAIPQKGNLIRHLAKARKQIKYYVSQNSCPGLAVIDWESWRPLWERNWDLKSIYKTLSETYARERSPHLSPQVVSKVAKRQFEDAARAFMEQTLSLGITERPSRRWGFYLFPDCYNHNWKDAKYTGRCSERTQMQNNQLLWLWERSTALFPSIYLPLPLSNSHKAASFARNRVQEALRVASLPDRPHTPPVYVYARPLYKEQTDRLLSEMDLISTVGESAALGATGTIMWGASRDYTNKEACESLSDYLTTTLNPYLANVTAAAMLCSEVLCQGNGRCVRKIYDSSYYLHLDPARFIVLHADGKYVAIGLPSDADLKLWNAGFTCQCYAGLPCKAKLAPPTQIKVMWV